MGENWLGNSLKDDHSKEDGGSLLSAYTIAILLFLKASAGCGYEEKLLKHPIHPINLLDSALLAKI